VRLATTKLTVHHYRNGDSSNATGARGHTTALVGNLEQVADSLFDYYKAGVTTLLIPSFEPVEDAIIYGRDVIPLVGQQVQREER